MEISIYGQNETTILTFRGITITSKQKDLCGRTMREYTLSPLSIQPHPKVLSNINIRMNMIQVDGNIQAIEQNIRLEVELQSLKEYELKRLQLQVKEISTTIQEICQLTNQW